MTTECVETGTLSALAVARPQTTVRTSTSSARRHLNFWFPATIGVFSLAFGLPLALGTQPIGNLMGIGLLFSLPSCAWYTWRNRDYFTPSGSPKQ